MADASGHDSSQVARKRAFLAKLAETGRVRPAAGEAGIPTSTLYGWRRKDPDFARAWTDALDHGADLLEDEAVRRALDGTERPVFYGGARIGEVREYSDSLLMFLLKARRPQRFKERGEGDGEVETDQLGQYRARLMARLARLIEATSDSTSGDAGTKNNLTDRVQDHTTNK